MKDGAKILQLFYTFLIYWNETHPRFVNFYTVITLVGNTNVLLTKFLQRYDFQRNFENRHWSLHDMAAVHVCLFTKYYHEWMTLKMHVVCEINWLKC